MHTADSKSWRSSERKSCSSQTTSSIFDSPSRLTASVRQLLDLYLPLCIGQGAERLVLGHVGQSLDGQIATLAGASRYVTGPENIVHMHRLRSLMDAVVVGAGTVELDDPELTTRLVPGDHPTRVVIDPTLRLAHARKAVSRWPRAHADRLQGAMRVGGRVRLAFHSWSCPWKVNGSHCPNCCHLWPPAASLECSSRAGESPSRTSSRHVAWTDCTLRSVRS